MRSVLLLLLIATALPTASSPMQPQPTKLAQAHLFELLVDKALKGARIAVHHTNGDVVLAEKLRKRKIVIDFSEVQRGTYTIQLRKGTRHQVYLFTKV
jgi:hypothetical protein